VRLALCCEGAGHSGQPDGQRVPLGWSETAQQLLVVSLEVSTHSLGRGAAFVGQQELVEASVGWCAPAHDPSPAFQPGGQPTDGALLKTEPVGKILLRHRLEVGEFPERHQLRQRDLQTGVLVRLEESPEPDQALERPSQLVVGERRAGYGCVLQLFRLRLGLEGCSIQL